MTRSCWLADLTSPEVAELASSGALLVVPVGSTEQHGPHLPLSTDTDIALLLCRELTELRGDVLIAPAVPYGSSGEHSGFAGTLSIGQDATELLLLELGRSAFETFSRLLFISAHGGNAEPVGRAVARLRAEGRDVAVFSPRWNGELHAGRTETALQLVIDADRVHLERAEPGNSREWSEIAAALRSGGVAAVSPNGILGNPVGATASEGLPLLDRLTENLRAHVDQWLGVRV